MINPDKALEIILNSKVSLGQENINVLNSRGRIISSDIYSSIDLPIFNKSAMDGYAYNSSGNINSFKVVETIAAGHIPQKTLNIGECSKIMTGAMIPDGADKIVRIEFTEEKDGLIHITQEEQNNNIYYKREDLKKGDKVFNAGTLIRIQEIASLSSIGLKEVSVYKQPVVGLITTGSEIINPGEELETGKIYNSNGPQLYNQITSIPAKCNYYGIINDDENAIRKCLEKAFTECNLIIISGGVSMGDYDYVPKILKELSVELKFEQIAVKPGKPIVFGEKNGVFVFGLPGNPVSTFVSFEVFVKPLIYKMMGYNFSPYLCKGELIDTIKRRNSDRFEYKPVYFDGIYIHPVEYHGSAHINVLCKTNALITFNKGIFELNKGEIIDVRQV
jgi:molybdopterin molybdotransferase